MTLITPTLIKAHNSDPVLSTLLTMTAGKSSDGAKIIGPGQVLMSHWNPEFEVAEISRDFERQYPEFDVNLPDTLAHLDEWDRRLDSYGVIDSPEQFMEFFGQILEDDPRDLIVTFVEIVREEQPPSGGWRYHKWGAYYGTQNPRCEYLYGDTHIDRVFTFHIYEVGT